MSDPTDTNERARVTIFEPERYAITLPRLLAICAGLGPIVFVVWAHTQKLDTLVLEMRGTREEIRGVRQELEHLQRNVPEVYDLETWRTEFALRNPTISVPQFRVRNGG